MSINENGPLSRPHISVASQNSTDHQSEELIESSPRQGRRSKADLGLPSDDELMKLARAYLETQRRLWPDILSAGLISEPTEDVLRTMVDDFTHRHRGGTISVSPLKVFLKYCKHLAGGYSRFSCDNSDPKSIIDQLVLELEKARQETRFAPWEYIFCDYSVSGFDSSRQGYNSYKKILANREHLIETTYIDDFSRASRQEVEWWKLASVSRKYQRRMIGASDNFSLDDPDWEIKIKLYALFSMLFKVSLQQKVRRGMRSAFREGGVVGKLILGHGRRPRRDESGEIIRRPNDKIKTIRCIDPKGRRFKRLMYRRYLKQNWSLHKIVKAFNKKKIDGWDRWCTKSVSYELGNPANVGVFIWNQYHHEYNWEEEKTERVENPRSEWEIYIDKSLGLVPIDWWKKARRKLARVRKRHPRTGKTNSRNELSPTTLFSGTLFCECCMNNEELAGRDAELKLRRSTPKYKQLACLNGTSRMRDCKLTTSKSTSIVENSLLPFVVDTLLTEERIRELFAKCNRHIEREARKPQVDIRPMQKRAREFKADIKKLFNRIKGCQSESLCKAYDAEITSLQSDLDETETEIRDAQQRNAPPPPPLELNRVKDYLADIRELLNQDIPAAGVAIRELTGRILIRQEKVPGRRKARWIATFSPKMLDFLRYVAREKNYPDTVTLENLCAANWIMPEEEVVEIDKVPEYERIAEEVGRMAKVARRSGEDVTANSIARALGKCCDTVYDALWFAETGERPHENPTRRAKKPRLGPAKKERIERMVRAGERTCDIAKEVGCCQQTVARMRKTLDDD